MKPCDRIGHLIGAYLYGDVTTDEADGVESHLMVCLQCRRDVETRRAALSALCPPAPTGLERERIMQGVQAAAMGANGERRRVWRRWRALAAMGAATAAALLFAVGVWVGGQRASGPGTPRHTPDAAARAVKPAPVARAPERVRPLALPPTELLGVERPARRPARRLRVEPPTGSGHRPPTVVVQAPRVVAPVPDGVDDMRLAALEE